MGLRDRSPKDSEAEHRPFSSGSPGSGERASHSEHGSQPSYKCQRPSQTVIILMTPAHSGHGGGGRFSIAFSSLRIRLFLFNDTLWPRPPRSPKSIRAIPLLCRPSPAGGAGGGALILPTPRVGPQAARLPRWGSASRRRGSGSHRTAPPFALPCKACPLTPPAAL